MSLPVPEPITPALVLDGVTVYQADCLEALRALSDCSVDSIVTDPPYEIGFMGKAWDGTGIAYQVDLWRECLRVLKPGGHLLAFGATRSYHRMTVAIEDAGFEIRDSIHWTYGSGFPKSLDVSKAIDKQRYDLSDIYRVTGWIRGARDAAGKSNKDIDAAFGFAGMAGHWTSTKSQPSVPTLEQVPTLLDLFGLSLDEVPVEIRELLWTLNGRKGQPGDAWFTREVVGISDYSADRSTSIGFGSSGKAEGERLITAPATPDAATWQGWGTALKPSHEPIVVARRPLVGTVAQTVLAHGTGALNIDACRVGGPGWGSRPPRTPNSILGNGKGTNLTASEAAPSGRWPANTVLTHAAGCRATGETTESQSYEPRLTQNTNLNDDGWNKIGAAAEKVERTLTVPLFACVPGCPIAELDQQSGTSKGNGREQSTGAFGGNGIYNKANGATTQNYSDSGGASRFFTCTEWSDTWDAPAFLYVAKPAKKERNAGLDGLPEELPRGANGSINAVGEGRGSLSGPRQNFHPTVKPVSLMRHLVRLVTPPGGIVLDPFLGSGTTAVAAILEGAQFVGCEMTAEYLPIIEGRVRHAVANRPVPQEDLFSEEAP